MTDAVTVHSTSQVSQSATKGATPARTPFQKVNAGPTASSKKEQPAPSSAAPAPVMRPPTFYNTPTRKINTAALMKDMPSAMPERNATPAKGKEPAPQDVSHEFFVTPLDTDQNVLVFSVLGILESKLTHGTCVFKPFLAPLAALAERPMRKRLQITPALAHLMSFRSAE